MLGSTMLFVAAGLVLILLAIPLIRRRVRPNPWYGLRTPSTFEDERVWYEANARSGRDVLLLGAIIVALALGLRAVKLSEAVYVTVIASLAVAGAFLAAFVGIVRARRLLRETRRRDGAADAASGER